MANRRNLIMAEQYYESPRNVLVGGVNVEITFARLTHKDKSDLRNFFQKYSLDPDTSNLEGIDLPAGGIEQLFIRRGLESMKVGTRTIQLDASNPVNSFPNEIGMGDDPEDVDLYEEVLKTGIDRNRWAGTRFPFNMVFGQYLAAVNFDKENDEKAAEKKADEEGRRLPNKDPNKPEDGDAGNDPLGTQADSSTVKVLSGSDIVGSQPS
jgi:hypothetical protein